jgi:hypothetical protein
MLASLRAQFAALSPRYRRLLLIALGLFVLLVLHRTAGRWVLQVDTDLDSRIEALQGQLQKLQDKISSRSTLVARRQNLLNRLADEDRLLLPDSTPAEAQNMLNACLQNLAVKTGVELSNVQTKPVTDVGERYRKVELVARTNSLTQNWTRFLYEIEALRTAQPGSGDGAGCPPLPLVVEDMTVRMPLGQNQHRANLMFNVSGLLRKPEPGAAGGSGGGPGPSRERG